MPGRPLTRAEEEEAFRLYREEGKTYKSLAKRYHTGTDIIYKAISRLAGERYPNKTKKTPAPVATEPDLFPETASKTDNIMGKQQKTWSDQDILAMCRLKASGASPEAIADHIGIDVAIVKQIWPEDAMPKEPCPTAAEQGITPQRPFQKLRPLGTTSPVGRTLDEFAERDIIRHLYDKGYRIEGDLILIQKMRVDLSEIIVS